MSSSSVSTLFQPLRVGIADLQHRVVMAPLTRFRANKDHVHGELAKTYYAQRSSMPGTLIISEATFSSPQAAGYTNVPGIWNAAQIAGWRTVCVLLSPRRSRNTDFFLLSQRLRMQFMPMALTYSFNFRPLDMLLILLCSSKKVASISSHRALSLSVILVAPFRANLGPRRLENTCNCTPRQLATPSRQASTA